MVKVIDKRKPPPTSSAHLPLRRPDLTDEERDQFIRKLQAGAQGVRLSSERRELIRADVAAGLSVEELIEKYNISRSSASYYWSSPLPYKQDLPHRS